MATNQIEPRPFSNLLDDLVPKATAAQWIHVSVRTLDRLVAAGAIPKVKVGHKTMFLRVDLIEFVEARRTRRGLHLD